MIPLPTRGATGTHSCLLFAQSHKLNIHDKLFKLSINVYMTRTYVSIPPLNMRSAEVLVRHYSCVLIANAIIA